ncbi:hypothetical protein GH733_011172 [Mirounga leonina]|nr:hypothetical protein GH733_011172 [Mirounga leonina]
MAAYDAGAPGGPGGARRPDWEAGGFHGGFSSGIWGWSRGCGQGGKTEDKEWIPNTKLGHLVKQEYWENKIGKPHTVPCKVTSRYGSVLVCLIPNSRGTGIVSAPVPKKLLMVAGIDNYTSARDCTATQGNYAKATFDDIPKTYSCLTPISGKRLCSPSL